MNTNVHLLNITILNSLYLDVGNSRIKIAALDNHEWNIIQIHACTEQNELINTIKNIQSNYDNIYVSCVVKPIAEVLVSACPADKLHFFTNEDIPQERISYKSYATMGVDRFIAATGAWIQSGKSCIVIDAGTACTVDYMDGKGIFQGGVIMPGLKIIEGGLLHSAKALPTVDRVIPDEWPPKSTKTALQWGIFGSYLSSIEAHVSRFQKNENGADVWLTGGDADLLKSLLPTTAVTDENLVFKGLQYLFRNIVKR